MSDYESYLRLGPAYTQHRTLALRGWHDHDDDHDPSHHHDHHGVIVSVYLLHVCYDFRQILVYVRIPHLLSLFQLKLFTHKRLLRLPVTVLEAVWIKVYSDCAIDDPLVMYADCPTSPILAYEKRPNKRDNTARCEDGRAWAVSYIQSRCIA